MDNSSLNESKWLKLDFNIDENRKMGKMYMNTQKMFDSLLEKSDMSLEEFVKMSLKHTLRGYYTTILLQHPKVKNFILTKDYEALGYQLGIPEVFLKHIVEEFGLFETDDAEHEGYFYSERLRNNLINMNKREEDKKREESRKGLKSSLKGHYDCFNEKEFDKLTYEQCIDLSEELKTKRKHESKKPGGDKISPTEYFKNTPFHSLFIKEENGNATDNFGSTHGGAWVTHGYPMLKT
ncbi:MAG: hypothetical protein Kapaf2KO_22730 [Candidatus Kapaibacteriales bacterium]